MANDKQKQATNPLRVNKTKTLKEEEVFEQFREQAKEGKLYKALLLPGLPPFEQCNTPELLGAAIIVFAAALLRAQETGVVDGLLNGQYTSRKLAENKVPLFTAKQSAMALAYDALDRGIGLIRDRELREALDKAGWIDPAKAKPKKASARKEKPAPSEDNY